MRPAHLPFLFSLFLCLILSMAMTAGAAETATPAPDDGAWLLLIVIGVIAIVVAAGLLVFAFRLVRAFGESTSSLVDALKALTPIPMVTLGGEIVEGVEGRLELRITGPLASPLEQVTVILVSPPGFPLEEDPITLPFLDAGETKIIRIGHGPVYRGNYPIRITVLYTIGEEERIQEFTRAILARNPAEPETID